MNDSPSKGAAPPEKRLPARVRGCLLGGAVGDALGAPVEFMSMAQIRETVGPEGVTDLIADHGQRGGITDDTQMTLFTAEGLLRSRQPGKPHEKTVRAVHRSYLRWLATQGEHSQHPDFDEAARCENNGWLIGLTALHGRRDPGFTCMSGLASPRMGTPASPLNESKGCGGVMRVAPAGLVCMDAADAFELGVATAAISHGHPSGYLSAGCQAAIIAGIVNGVSLREAIDQAVALLVSRPNHQECLAALKSALEASQRKPSADVVASLGEGWVGEEALAIAVYCALSAQNDFARGVLLAVNHSGDSDSTGAIAGNILGALLGVEAIPARWLEGLELRDVIESVADDLLAPRSDASSCARRYPIP